MSIDEQHGLAPTRRRLQNGVVVLAKESRVTPAVAMTVEVQAGTVSDPHDLPGVAHFLSRVIDRGTEHRSADDIAELLDSRGVSLAVAAMRHLFTVSCTCLAEDFSAMLALIGDIVRHPSLPDSEIATRRGEIITSIRQDHDNPAAVALEEELALLYPNHPYGQRMKGTLESVEQIDRRRLARAHHDRFEPSSLVVTCVGDVDPGRVVDECGMLFGDWRSYPVSLALVPGLPPVERRRQVVFPMMNKAQADIAYGFTTIARRDPAYYAFSLMNNVLGQYALGGRLGDSIRERQGMAYYVFSAFEPNIGPGPLVIRAGVNPANVDRAIASIDEEVRRMAADGLTEEELRASKRYLISSLPRTLETNAGIANFLLTCEQFGLGLDYDQRLPELLEAVTLEEANGAARRFLVPGRATITIAGPYAAESPEPSA
ncbi:MAG TPA: pitrilysin family protein [Vicinamibacterales bacterium]|jgi:zinc protease